MEKTISSKWLMTEIDILDSDHCIDLIESSYISFFSSGRAELCLGTILADVHCHEVNQNKALEFTFLGGDEFSSVSGSGWVKNEYGRSNGKIRFHNGDTLVFSAIPFE